MTNSYTLNAFYQFPNMISNLRFSGARKPANMSRAELNLAEARLAREKAIIINEQDEFARTRTAWPEAFTDRVAALREKEAALNARRVEFNRQDIEERKNVREIHSADDIKRLIGPPIGLWHAYSSYSQDWSGSRDIIRDKGIFNGHIAAVAALFKDEANALTIEPYTPPVYQFVPPEKAETTDLMSFKLPLKASTWPSSLSTRDKADIVMQWLNTMPAEGYRQVRAVALPDSRDRNVYLNLTA